MLKTVIRPVSLPTSLIDSQLLVSNARVPSLAEDDNRFNYDPFSSTRDCLISRTPSQRKQFEQALANFKGRHSIPILIVIPVSDSVKIITDMTRELVQFTELFGPGMVQLAFGVGPSDDDDTYLQISQTSEALHSAKVSNRVRFTENLAQWTHDTLMSYSADFRVAIVLGGVICAIDLARLLMHAVENDADLTCAVDITFSPQHLMLTNTGNIDWNTGKPIAVEDLVRSPKFIQAGCCDGSVKVLAFKSIEAAILDDPCSLHEQCSQADPSAATWDHLGRRCPPARIMISPSVKSAPDTDDFHTVVQLGFLDLQGFDYEPIEWQDGAHYGSH